MKIKPRPKGKGKVNSKAYHYWLEEEKPKKVSRLPQLNKRNKRLQARYFVSKDE